MTLQIFATQNYQQNMRLAIFSFGRFYFLRFYPTKEFFKGYTALQDQGLYLEFNFKDLLLCLFYCFIYVYLRASWDVEGIKDRTYSGLTLSSSPKRQQFCCILPNLPSSSFAAYFRTITDYVNPWTGHPSRTPLGLVLRFLPQESWMTPPPGKRSRRPSHGQLQFRPPLH